MIAIAGAGVLAWGQSTPPESVAKAQQRLLQLTVSDDMGDVPAPVSKAIGSLKDALTQQTDAIVTQLPPDVTAVVARRKLAAALPSPKVGETDYGSDGSDASATSNKPVAGLFGGALRASVTQPRPSILLVQESFNIVCGADTLLLVYRSESGKWSRVLRWQSKSYADISGAFGDSYETLLLKPERNGHPVLLVLHGAPWCTSTMSAFKMDAFELGVSLEDGPFWEREHGYRRADLDPALTLRATEDGFEVRTSVSTSGDKIARKGVMRYAVEQGEMHRVEPLAMNGQDSVEEWLELPRKDAAEFVDASAEPLAWKMFESFTYEGKSSGANMPLVQMGAVRACGKKTGLFQVEVTSEIFETNKDGSRPGPAYFVQIREAPNGYRIHAVTEKRDSACDGPDIMGGGQ